MIEIKTTGNGVAVSVDATLPELLAFLDETTEQIIKQMAEKELVEAMAASIVINKAISNGIDAAMAEAIMERRTPS